MTASMASAAAVVGGVPSVLATGLSKHFGATRALHNISLRLNEGEVVAVTGPSGAGKSTLARLISGLEVPSGGDLHLAGLDMRGQAPQGRRVAHMFESFALYPTRTVRENVSSPLLAPANRGRWSAAETAKRIDEVLSLTEMSALCERYPSQLSGGQKQRVALCRALVQDPSVFVLDEPIGHLDAKLRHRLRGDIRRRQRALRPGTLWLTPDGLEAMAVADRVVVLIDGRIHQVDTPDTVFERPANVQVARLIGDPAMNVLPLQWLSTDTPAIQVGDGEPVRASAALIELHRRHAKQDRGLLGLRPSELQVFPQDPGLSAAPEADCLHATVYAVEPLGKTCIISVDVGGQRLRARLPGVPNWPPGMPVTVAFDATRSLSFDPDSGMLCP
jgi:multiple sugar transport system ATP-binding protein